MMKIRILSVFIFAFLIASCGTTKLSTKDENDIIEGRKATLKTFNQPIIGAVIFGEEPVTRIVSVDGNKLPSVGLKNDEIYAIETGIHKIELSCINRRVQDERDYVETIEINFRAHHEYRVRCSFDTEFGPDGTYVGSFSVEENRIK